MGGMDKELIPIKMGFLPFPFLFYEMVGLFARAHKLYAAKSRANGRCNNYIHPPIPSHVDKYVTFCAVIIYYIATSNITATA